MKGLTLTKKHKVIKLFLTGLSYDEIAQQVGIAKGSVVNIVDEFREGIIPLPLGMTEYVDELRKLVVDTKKHDTSVAQLKSYAKLHARIQEMGVDDEHVDLWLDICQGIASEGANNSQFVSAALELAAKKAETGLSYQELLDDYEDKTKAVQLLDTAIEKKTDERNQVKQQLKEEKEQAIQELKTITEAIATAQDTFKNQKKELKSQLNEYMAQNKLTWQKVKVVSAILSTAMAKAGLSKEETEKISEGIAYAGSLVVYTGQMEQKNKELESRANELKQEEAQYKTSVGNFKHMNKCLCDKFFLKTLERDELDKQLQARKAEIAELEDVIAEYIYEIKVTWRIIGFLTEPKCLSDTGFDELFGLLISLRQHSLGVAPKWIVDEKGNAFCQFPVPRMYTDLDKYKTDEEEVYRRLAYYLVPLVQDKFMPRFEYEAAQLTHSILELDKKLWSLKQKQ